jgi:hypothetical protein
MFLFLLLLWRPNLRGRCLRRVRSWRGWTDGFRPVEILFVVVVLDVDFGQLVLRFSPTLLMIELRETRISHDFAGKLSRWQHWTQKPHLPLEKNE